MYKKTCSFILSVLGVWLICNCAYPETLVEQHKKLMMDAIIQCNVVRVGKLLETPYVDPDEILNDQNQVNPPYRGLATESYASLAVKSNCNASDVIEIWTAIKAAGGDLNRGLGGMNPLQATFNRRTNVYQLAEYLLDSGVNPRGNPPTYTVGPTNTSLVMLSNSAGWITDEEALSLIKKIGANFAAWGIASDINERNADGSTALLIAVFNRLELRVVQVLVSEGADIKMRSPSGWSPHEVLLYHGCDHITKSATFARESAEYKVRNQKLLTYFEANDPIVVMMVHQPSCPRIYR
jgi:hypothetical protein